MIELSVKLTCDKCKKVKRVEGLDTFDEKYFGERNDLGDWYVSEYCEEVLCPKHAKEKYE